MCTHSCTYRPTHAHTGSHTYVHTPLCTQAHTRAHMHLGHTHETEVLLHVHTFNVHACRCHQPVPCGPLLGIRWAWKRAASSQPHRHSRWKPRQAPWLTPPHLSAGRPRRGPMSGPGSRQERQGLFPLGWHLARETCTHPPVHSGLPKQALGQADPRPVNKVHPAKAWVPTDCNPLRPRSCWMQTEPSWVGCPERPPVPGAFGPAQAGGCSVQVGPSSRPGRCSSQTRGTDACRKPPPPPSMSSESATHPVGEVCLAQPGDPWAGGH